MSNQPLPALEPVIQIARAAGDATLAIYRREDFEVRLKGDESPLTEADLASHRVICERLAALTPELPILSEESARIPFSERSQWQRYWLIDPLDGTREFIKRNDEFTVNIALIDNHRPVLGVVHVPASGVTYHGSLESPAAKREQEQDQRIHVRTRRGSPLLVAGSRSHAGDSLLRFLERAGEHELVSMGSSLKLCLVAEGKADIYPRLGPTSEWDTAAAQAVVIAAGGRVTDLELRDLEYNRKESLLNPFFLVFGDQNEDWARLLD